MDFENGLNSSTQLLEEALVQESELFCLISLLMMIGDVMM